MAALIPSRPTAMTLYGNRTSVTDPNLNPTTTVYDTATNTFPETTTYSSLFSTQRTWDHRYGKPLTDTDFNNRTTTTRTTSSEEFRKS